MTTEVMDTDAPEAGSDAEFGMPARSATALPPALRELLRGEALIESLIDPEQGARATGLPVQIYQALTRPGSRVRRRITAQVVTTLLHGADPVAVFRMGLPLPADTQELTQAGLVTGLATLLQAQGGMLTRAEFAAIEAAFGASTTRMALDLRQIAPALPQTGAVKPLGEPKLAERLGYRLILSHAGDCLPTYEHLLRIFLPGSHAAALDGMAPAPVPAHAARALVSAVTQRLWHGHLPPSAPDAEAP